MSARLAFAVATDVDPDILLVDEALSVGDEKFRRKCHDRMDGLRARGKTFMLASHSLSQIRDNCDRVLWLHHGRVVRDGDDESVTDAYHQWSLGETDLVAPGEIAERPKAAPSTPDRSGSDPVEREPKVLTRNTAVC